MFNVLKKAFRSEPPPSSPKQPHSMQEQGPITALLMQIYRAHVLLNVSFPPEEMRFSSALLGIYDEHGFIVLDEITPRAGHKRLLEKKQLLVAGRLNGVDFHFRTRLIDVREKGGAALYKTELPGRIIYQQRRLNFRITTLGHNVPFHCLRGSGNHQILKGYIHDISQNGLGVILDDDVTLEQGEKLSSCIITLPGQGDVVCSLEVCFCARNKPRGITRLGCRFQQIENSSRRKIQQVINELERDKARRLHSD